MNKPFEILKSIKGSNLCSSCFEKIDENKVQCEKCKVREEEELNKIFRKG